MGRLSAVRVAELPAWFDSTFVSRAAVVLIGIAIVALVAVLLAVRSVALRLVAVLLLGAAAVGLWHYRDEVRACRDGAGTCSCSFLGNDLPGCGS